MDVIAQIFGNLAALGFSNISVTSIYGAIANAIGQIINNIIAELANTISIIVNLLISQQGYGKATYYTNTALAFQYGDNLTINTDINPVTGEPYENLIYTTIDTTKQIVSQAAFQASGMFLKVATPGISGGLAPLTDAELTAFKAYMLNFEILSIPLNIISIPANVLLFNSFATYLSSFDLPTLQSNLLTALTTFQTTFPYNGEFYVTDLENYIQTNVPGIRSFFINNTMLDGVSFSDYMNLNSGYFNFDPTVFTGIVYNAVSN